MESLSNLLDRKREEIKRPPNLPVGHYRFRITRHTIADTASGEWEIVTFFCRAQAAQEDVEPGELEEYGKAVENATLRKRFMFGRVEDTSERNEDNLFYMQEFIKAAGVEAEEDTTMREQLELTENCEFIGEVVHNPDKNDPEIIHQEINRTFSIDDFGDVN